MKVAHFMMLASACSAASLSHSDIDSAVKNGGQFKSRSKFLEAGLKANKVQLASLMAKDGISKYVTFFTDYEMVEAAAAEANQQMRVLGDDDIAKLPLTGLIYANVEVLGRGMLPIRKVEKRYSGASAHLVLKFGEDVVQPLSKERATVKDASLYLPIALYTWWQAGNVSILTGGQLGFDGVKSQMEFVFSLSPEQRMQRAEVILIDGDGNKHGKNVDFSKIFH